MREPPKLEPALTALVGAAASAATTASRGPAEHGGAEPGRLVHVMIKYTGDTADLEAVGFQAWSVRTHPTDGYSIAAGPIPLDRLGELESIPHIQFVEASRPFEPELNHSVPEINRGPAALGVDPAPRNGCRRRHHRLGHRHPPRQLPQRRRHDADPGHLGSDPDAEVVGAGAPPVRRRGGGVQPPGRPGHVGRLEGPGRRPLHAFDRRRRARHALPRASRPGTACRPATAVARACSSGSPPRPTC